MWMFASQIRELRCTEGVAISRITDSRILYESAALLYQRFDFRAEIYYQSLLIVRSADNVIPALK